MSITIHKSLDTLTPVYNVNPFIINSDNNGEDNFYYLYTIVDADGNVASLRQSKDPDGDSIFDPNSLTKNKISYNFNGNKSGLNYNEGMFYQYKVSYGTISDGTYDTSVTTDIVNSFNMAQPLGTYDMSDYLLNSSDSMFLTDFQDANIVVTKDDYYSFNYINGDFGTAGDSYLFSINFKMYKEDGTTEDYFLLNTLTHPSISTSTFWGTPEKIVASAGVGPKNLLDGTVFDSGYNSITLDPKYFDDVIKYEVNATSPSQSSKVYTFELKCKALHTNYQIFYLNHLGGFDGITFNHGNTKKIKQKSTTFQKATYRKANNDYTYTEGNRGETILNKNVTEYLEVYTDYVTDDYLDIYEGMQSSTVHIMYENGVEVPLVLTNTEAKLQEKANRRRYQIKFTFEYANSKTINY